MSTRLVTLGAVVLLVCLSGQEGKGQEASETKNPYSSAKDARQGDVFLRSWCATCHGRDARGGRGPDLTDGNFRHGSSDQAVFDTIKDGIPGTDMIGLTDLDDMSIWQLVAAIRAREKPVPLPEFTPQDVEAGRALFVKNNCSTCHWNGKVGGNRGVNFTTSTASVEYIRTSILDPDANFREVPGRDQHPNQKVVVVTTSGNTVVGRWLNETGAHILLADEQDDLRILPRDGIEVITKPRHSLMPTFKDSLNERQIERLVAYLFSIRKVPRQKESK